MPMIDLTFVRGSLDDEAMSRLTDELVTALLRAERAPDTAFMRDNTVVYLHPWSPPISWWVAANPARPDFVST